jgi:hypothetical protein
MSSSASTLRSLAFVALTGWSTSAMAAPAAYHSPATRHPASVPAPRGAWRFGAAPAKPSATPHHAAPQPNRATGTQTLPGMRPDQITHH